jgi:pentatricopeptide repeat protein
MITMMLRLVIILQIAAVIKSFSTVAVNRNRAASSLLQLNAKNNQKKVNPIRATSNKRRTSMKWVIQGVEKCLAEEDESSSSKHGGKKTYSYRRRIDASLVDALYLMHHANSQTEVLDAEKRIKVLLKNPSEFPLEVTERVIRATSLAGLSLSVDLLQLLLRGDDPVLPSSIAYISVLSFLRRNGRVDRLEETLAELASVSRGIQRKNPSSNFGIDIVAFNTYLGAICDAAVAGRPYPSFDDKDEITESNMFNFTNFNNTLDGTTSSEKYLYKGLNLLRGDVARKKFALECDPDIYSFNSLLAAVAKCSKPGRNLRSISDSCLLTMKKQGVDCDTLTYNARIQAAVAADEEDYAIQLIDELLIVNPNLAVDRYTINLALIPFVKAQRKGQILALMRDFYDDNAGRNNQIIVSAFEAFLNTLVQSDEVGLARDVFDAFFLSIPKDRMQLTGIRPNPTTKHFNIMLSGYSKTGDAQKAFELFDKMLGIGVAVDGFTVSSLMTHSTSSETITSLLTQIEAERVILNPAAYRAIIGAYGNSGDAASACLMFAEMGVVCQQRGRGIESWNVLLGALARGCTGDDATSIELDIYNSNAAKRGSDTLAVEELTNDEYISLVDGKSCLDATFVTLELMRNGNQSTALFQTPKPNSQTYCLIASALSRFGTSEPQPEQALQLFRDAINEGGVNPDGRFLNAILRCFGDDVEAVLAAWKSDIGPAAATQQKKGKINLQQAYNGVAHVCGRALRPDIALRTAYAMNKAGVEPTEVTLNSYKSGKRVAMEKGIVDRLGLKNQYETLLSVECTKYNRQKWDKSKRRAGDKKIRIIL